MDEETAAELAAAAVPAPSEGRLKVAGDEAEEVDDKLPGRPAA